MDELTKQSKWYDKTWLVIILCIIFFPVGLYALWKNSSISKGWKIGVTIVIALIVIAQIGNDEKTSTTTADESTTTSNSNEKELTQAQKDSIAKTERLAVIEERKKQTISAADLTQNYIDNEVRADENFKDKEFYVEGTVNDIKKDIMDDIYVTLNGSEMFREVQCYFDDKNTASQLEKGMRVTFHGKCDGLMMNVLMKNCKLVDNLKDLEEANK
jgi:K+ transporter